MDIPDLVERSFRSMIRETIFIRPAGASFAEDAIARAARYLDVHLAGTGSAASRKRAGTALSTAVERFVRSRLCDRLRLVSASQLFASDLPDYDLLVIGADHKRYGVRFVAGLRSVPTASGPSPKAVEATPLDEIVTYDLRSGMVKREIRSLSTRCA